MKTTKNHPWLCDAYGNVTSTEQPNATHLLQRYFFVISIFRVLTGWGLSEKRTNTSEIWSRNEFSSKVGILWATIRQNIGWTSFQLKASYTRRLLLISVYKLEMTTKPWNAWWRRTGEQPAQQPALRCASAWMLERCDSRAPAMTIIVFCRGY